MNEVEPYWNVNLIYLDRILSVQTNEVEPYWNVNQQILHKQSLPSSE